MFCRRDAKRNTELSPLDIQHVYLHLENLFQKEQVSATSYILFSIYTIRIGISENLQIMQLKIDYQINYLIYLHMILYNVHFMSSK